MRADERSTSSRQHPCGVTCGRKIYRTRDMYFQPIGCTKYLRTCHSCIFAHATPVDENLRKLQNIAYEALCLADTGQTNTTIRTHRNLVKITQETPARKSKKIPFRPPSEMMRTRSSTSRYVVSTYGSYHVLRTRYTIFSAT